MEIRDDWSEISVGKGKRILVVDAEMPTIQALKQYLLRDGYQVSLARSGHEALNMMQTQEEPDLIILELSLPDMDGFAVAYEVRKRSGVPIVVLSSITDKDTKIEALIEFAHDYVAKPFYVEEIATRVYRILMESSKDRALVSNFASRSKTGCRLGVYVRTASVATSHDGHRRYDSKRQVQMVGVSNSP